MSLKKSRPLALILIVLLIVMTGITGCGTSNLKTQSNNISAAPDNSNSVTNSSSASSTPAPNSTTPVTLYFPASDASGLVAVSRSVNVSNGEILKAMFTELNNPPSGLEPGLPKGTQLLGASIKDGVATLDLSKEFKSNFEGGGTGEQMILYSIVNTLTTLPNVKSVQFLLNGEKSITILREMDTSTPLTRDESLIKK